MIETFTDSDIILGVVCVHLELINVTAGSTGESRLVVLHRVGSGTGIRFSNPGAVIGCASQRPSAGLPRSISRSWVRID